MRKVIIVFFVPVLFFLISFFTLKDYGVSWDEPEHFLRGQGYLHFYLTGEKKFSENNPRPSYYQDNSLPAKHFFENDNGHPPLNDILAALTNKIFYQKLGIMGDIDSYHLFNILCATLLVLIVSVFAYNAFGVVSSAQKTIGAIVAGIVASGYPLLFSEGHFNIKDPPQAAFYTLAIFAFWMSLQKGNWKWLLLSIISVAFSFGMKFNVLFMPFIIFPYLIIRYWSNLKIQKKWIPKLIKSLKKIPRKYLLILFLSPIIIVTIFYASWPFLWADPFENFLIIAKYYKSIGTGFEYQPGFYINGFNLYPIIWVITTTQPVVLVLLFVGMIVALRDKTKDKVYTLWLIWILFPILRVTIPGASIYGGVRQIMEYIPALALLSAVGFCWLIQKLEVKIKKYKFKFKNFEFVFMILIFAFILWPLVKYHPHQNVYFNFLMGGLKGAKEKNIPYWGNSYGNAYLPIIKWMNENAPQDAHLALIQGTALNIPAITLRSDIVRWNSFWSGIDRKGEYLTELTYGSARVAYPYAWEYVEKFLEPVYEVKVDGVTIAGLWKNDLEHTKLEMRDKKEVKYLNPKIFIEEKKLMIELSEEKILNKLIINYKEDPSCRVGGIVETTTDFKVWTVERETIPTEQISEKKMIKDGVLTFYFPGRVAKGIRITPSLLSSCLISKPIVEIYILE